MKHKIQKKPFNNKVLAGLKNTDLALPIVKGVINALTLGLGAIPIETFEAYQVKLRNQNIKDFKKDITKVIRGLQKQVSPLELKRRIQSPEFLQILMKLIQKIQFESREEIRKAYANFLRKLLKEDLKINFNQKLFYLDILTELNEHQLKILSIFYKGGDIKDIFKFEAIYEKMDCYDKRKLKPGERYGLFDDGREITELNELKAWYTKGLLSDMGKKQIIEFRQDVETEIKKKKDKEGNETDVVEDAETNVDEYYRGTELGRDFYKYILDTS